MKTKREIKNLKKWEDFEKELFANKQVQEIYKIIQIKSKNTMVFLEIDKEKNKMAILSLGKAKEFRFANRADKEILKRWKEVLSLMQKAVKILENEI